MVKNFFETIESRRSVRKFKSDSISDEMLQKIIAAGCLAPSAGNVQPWKFYIIRQQENKELLARAAGQSFVAQAPVVVVVVAEPEEAAAKYGDRGREALLHPGYCSSSGKHSLERLRSRSRRMLGWCFSEEAVSRI